MRGVTPEFQCDAQRPPRATPPQAFEWLLRSEGLPAPLPPTPGLYDVWEGADGHPMFSFCIITMDATPKMAWLHDRMPLLLRDDAAVDAWLVRNGPGAAALCRWCGNVGSASRFRQGVVSEEQPLCG